MKRSELEKVIWRCTLLGCLALLVETAAWGQAKVLIEYGSELLPVVAMDGETPLVEVNGERQPVYSGRVTVVEAERYTDGAVEIMDRAAEMGQDYGSREGNFYFRFDATVKAERDFEDCFLLLAITPQNGEATHVLRELADINAAGTQRLLVTIPVNPGFGGGTFGYMLFSRGEEIRRSDANEDVSIRENRRQEQAEQKEPRRRSSPPDRSRAAEAGGRAQPARAIDARLPEFPDSLVGVLSGGYAEIVYSIDERGRAFEILGIRADHADLVPEAWKTVVRTRYAPAYFNGRPLVATVRQKLFFNEFASFAEEMVMIPYPHLQDGPPRAVYAPLPEVAVDEPHSFSVQATIDRLGRVQSPRAADASQRELAEATLGKVKEWIFLPGISGGFPVTQEVEIPVKFEPSS